MQDHPEIKPLSAGDNPRVCVPLRTLVEVRPEDAGRLFDELFDSAEKKFGEWPAFKLVTREKRLLCAIPREQPAGAQRPSH